MQTDPQCTPNYGCADLMVTELHVEVGVFQRELATIPCPASLTQGDVQVMVPYQPEQDLYMIDASFFREGSTVYLTAGPFTEDESQTPWKLLLR